MNRSTVLTMLLGRQGGRSLRKFAKDMGISAAYLSDVYRGRRDPGPSMLKVLKLQKRVEKKITYEAKEKPSRVITPNRQLHETTL